MNDSKAKLMHHLQPCQRASVAAFALSVVCIACSSEDEGGRDAPAVNPALGAGGTGTGTGTGTRDTPGGTAPVVPSTEQPAAGNGTPIDVSAAAAGSAATYGSSGTDSIAAAGSSMAAAAGGAVPVDTPGSTGCENGAFFCEDFDGLTHGALPPGVNGMEPERTAYVIADAERGQVLQLQAAPGYGNKAGIFLNDFSHPDNGSHFGRMFVNVGVFPVLASDHWVMVEVTGSTGDQVRPVGGQFERWAPGADGLSAGDWTDWEQSSVETVAGVWHCVEWQVDGANGGNDLLLWVDDVEIRPLERPGFAFPTFNRLWIGWVVYLQGEPSQYEVLIDNIVLSTQRIGCN